MQPNSARQVPRRAAAAVTSVTFARQSAAGWQSLVLSLKHDQAQKISSDLTVESLVPVRRLLLVPIGLLFKIQEDSPAAWRLVGGTALETRLANIG